MLQQLQLPPTHLSCAPEQRSSKEEGLVTFAEGQFGG
jgi:hypothetical protein